MRRLTHCTFFLLAGLLLWPTLALATGSELIVNCDNPKAKLPTINAALKLLDPAGVNVLRISGTCHESVTIDAFRHLTLAGNPTATIIGPDDQQSAIFINNGSNVWLQDLTVEGGFTSAVWCSVSLCQFYRLKVQNSTGNGIFIHRGTAMMEDITTTNTLYGLCGRGANIRVLNGTFEKNLWYGIWVDTGTSLVLANGLSVRNNGTDSTDGAVWAGIQVDINSNITVNNTNQYTTVISGNSGPGINVTGGSMVNIQGTSVSNNGGAAEINVGNHSFAKLVGNTISAGAHNAVNIGVLSLVQFGGDDVSGFIRCGGQFSAISGYQSLPGTASTDCSH